MQLIRRLILSTLVLFISNSNTQAEEQEQALYFDLSPSIIVNLDKGAQYARCDIQLMARGDDQIEELELHSAALRNEFLFLIPEFDGKSLKTPKGKEELRKKALKATQDLLQELTGSPIIEGVYFTAFYVQ